MICNVSHEFWTPLNAIVFGNDFIETQVRFMISNLNDRELIVESIHKILKWVGNVKTSTKLLIYLINDLIDLGWIKNDQFVPHASKVSIFDFMITLEELFINQCNAKKLKFDLLIDNKIENSSFEIDEEWTKQILVNLI